MRRVITDIRPIKRQLRAKYRKIREGLDPAQKQAWDEAILKKITSTHFYKEAKTLLCFVSTAIEVDTYGIIRQAFADGKRVALPRCVPGTRNMNFHYISSLDELSPGTFSVPEPSPDAPIALRPRRALMIVPALSLDWSGYRLGYGICYSADCRRRLRHGRFDRTVDTVITEQYIRRTTSSHHGDDKK